MRYLVQWAPSAEEQLTQFWLLSTNRSEMATAISAVDRLLATSEGAAGQELSEQLFMIDSPPFRLLFEIYKERRVIWVVAIHLMP